MPQYLYQVAYTSESLAAQIKNPQDRLELVGKQIADAVGAKILGGGYSYGKYDIAALVEAPDDVTMAAVAVAIALRESLIALAAARLAGESQQTKMELVYQYLTGPRFRHRIEAVVERFSDMQADLDRERKTMMRLWAKREEQIRGVVESTAGLSLAVSCWQRRYEAMVSADRCARRGIPRGSPISLLLACAGLGWDGRRSAWSEASAHVLWPTPTIS